MRTGERSTARTERFRQSRHRVRASHVARSGPRRKQVMSSIRTFISSVATVTLLTAAASAHALTIQVGTYANAGMGAEFATPYDTFTLTGSTFTVAATEAPTVVSFGTFVFEVGPNCSACSLTPSFHAL